MCNSTYVFLASFEFGCIFETKSPPISKELQCATLEFKRTLVYFNNRSWTKENSISLRAGIDRAPLSSFNRSGLLVQILDDAARLLTRLKFTNC